MKISGPSQIQSKTVKKSKGKSATTGTSFASELSETPDNKPTASASVGAQGPLTSVDALLSLQEVGSSATASDGRSKGLARAEDMLDALEEIRKGILLGAIPATRLRALADMARNHKDASGDKRLSDILSDIELRSEVELAKLGI